MNNKQLSTLKAVFSRPTPVALEWARIESLFGAVGAKTIEGNGSRVRFELNGVVATFHRPHPDKEAKPYLHYSVPLAPRPLKAMGPGCALS